MKYQTVIMSVLFCVGLSCEAATAYDFVIPGDSSHNWRDVDNADNAVDGSWWKTSSAWCAIPNQPGANAHVYGQSGKSRTLIIPANETITSNDVSVIYVNVNKTSAPATLIVRGVITNGVGIVVGGTGGNGGHYGNVVIDGGRATLGGVLSGEKTAKSLIVSSPNSGKKSWDCGIAVTNGFLRLTAAAATLAGMTNCYARMDVTNSILIVEEGLKVGPGNTIVTDPAVLRRVRDDSNTHSEFTVSGKSRVSLSGLTLGAKSETEFAGETEVTGLDGDDDFPVVEMSLGAKLRLSDRVKVRANLKCNDGTTYPAGQAAHAPMTNVIELAGGSLVSSKGGFASSSARIPLRFVQTGGAFTNLASMTFACPHALVDIEKGEYRVDHDGGLYAGMVPSKPYFLRKRGLSVVSMGFLGVNSYSSTEQATASYVNEDNIIFEQVIDEDGLEPMEVRNPTGGGTANSGNVVVGNHRLRPHGGVQVVSTNAFALLHRTSATVVGVATAHLASVPDASLWATGILNGNAEYWGCTLKSAAKIPLSRTGSVYDSGTVAARPMGYCELPKVKTDGLNGVRVDLTVSSGSMTKVSEALTTAGYEDVTTTGQIVSFGIPVARIADKSESQKLLLDFTETPMPAQGMQEHVEGEAPYAYPVVTNALFTCVKVTYDRKPSGLILLFR